MIGTNHPNLPILEIAVPVPLRQTFDFIKPDHATAVMPGTRVRVPFGRRTLVGMVIAEKADSDYPIPKLKAALEIIDSEPVFEDKLWTTLQWLSSYYLAPIGEVLDTALPVKLRQGEAIAPLSQKSWGLSEVGRSSHIEELNRAPLQLAIIKRFMRSARLNSGDFRNDTGGWRQAIKALLDKGWLTEYAEAPCLNDAASNLSENLERSINLNQEQQEAVDQLQRLINDGSFSCSLLHGVTGSGKTEVYFEAMRSVLDVGKQVLLLVPEIGLTPQLISRVRSQMGYSVVVMHSGLSDTERHLAWWHTRQGDAQIVIGTRSAVFSSFANLGLIVVDEEHDGSFKQQEGVRYHARDVAVYRAKQQSVPIILGSATPCLETYANAQRGRYKHLRLRQRATKAKLPIIELFDTNVLPTRDGLSPAMLEVIANTLDSGKQVMLFLNRRGYAPVLYCSECGETAKCHRCDSHLTLHQRINRLRCHHCGYEGVAPKQCGSCKQATMVEVGEGTQRVEDALESTFPEARLLRIDRDTTSRKGELERLLEMARTGEVDIILGTQLLTKGHDFPNVATVGILGADQGLYSTDFRASEALFQQIVQVAGRAGRRDSVGRVYIQTAFPTHPLFEWVQQHDFDSFAEDLMAQRQAARYPPFGYFALLRAESTHQAKALQFLRGAKADLVPADGVRVMDAIPAPMERRAGRYRAQLLICAEQRAYLNTTLVGWLVGLNSNDRVRKLNSTVRWSLDIDPLDHY